MSHLSLPGDDLGGKLLNAKERAAVAQAKKLAEAGPGYASVWLDEGLGLIAWVNLRAGDPGQTYGFWSISDRPHGNRLKRGRLEAIESSINHDVNVRHGTTVHHHYPAPVHVGRR